MIDGFKSYRTKARKGFFGAAIFTKYAPCGIPKVRFLTFVF